MKNKKFLESFRRPLHLTGADGRLFCHRFCPGTEQPPEPEQTTEVDATNDSNVVIEENRGQSASDTGGQRGFGG